MKSRIISVLMLFTACTSFFTSARADEGMWMLNNLSARTDSVLHSLGLELTREQLYSENGPSLSKAVVMFGGFCSGVVVSPNGLVFTNHHCGYGSIQAHSSTKHDYLTNGFIAKSYKEELPNPNLYVVFNLGTTDVTELVTKGVTPGMSREERGDIIDSLSTQLTEAFKGGKGEYAEITPYYKGSKYYMTIYKRYDDVRLVCAPPQCLGKFGGDTDNWVWPRQTCDFSVFRIYAGADNEPATYSKKNKPYKTVNYVPVSVQGYQPGSYCMTLGYPGGTDRYLSSYGIRTTMLATNEVMHQIRGVKQDVWTRHMNADETIRIMYSAKYAESANYWKFALGQNTALKNLNVVEEKEQLEAELREWINADTIAHKQYVGVLDSLQVLYDRTLTRSYLMTMMEESFANGSELLSLILTDIFSSVQNEDGESDFQNKVKETYKNLDLDTDKEVFAALLTNYRDKLPAAELEFGLFDDVDSLFNGDIREYTNYLYTKSIFARPADIASVKQINEVVDDPLCDFAFKVFSMLYFVYSSEFFEIKNYERLLGEAIREMNNDKEYYPDANFTMRLSLGSITPLNNNYYTTASSFIEKVDQTPANPDFKVTPEVDAWMRSGNFGSEYTDNRIGQMPLCFLTNNDITGGNSGSGMYDGKGRLIGLAFDGNWEAMSGDIKFDNNLQRTIGVDIRWVLSVIDKYSNGKRLIKELTIE